MMKKTTTVLLLCVSLLALVLPAGAAELRGLWVDAFHPGIKSAAETDALVAKAKECNFNTLFVQVRKRGDVYYKSSVEPMANDVAPYYDPLADVVAKAHAAGLKVHAWIAVYEAFSPSRFAKPQPNQVHLLHPEWLMKDFEGDTLLMPNKVYLDPGHPSVQTYLASIVAEIVKNYQVDGIHLDGVRYPSPSAGYNDASVSAFNKLKKRTGKPDPSDPDWCNWRRSQVDQFIKLAFGKMPRSKRTVMLSAAVSESTQSGYSLQFQDVKNWVKSGTVNFLVPMVFAQDDRVFEASVADLVSSVGARYLCIGQAGFKLGSEHSAKQISMARGMGVSGAVVYSYYYCSKTDKNSPTSLMDVLKSGLYASPDVSPF